MKVLALELSSAVGSAAFRDGDKTQLVRQFPADRKHSGEFYANLGALYQSCGAPEMIVVGLGPGSYAGVRIAIATALGLKAASGARLIGLPSICAFAAGEYCVIGDARRNSFFVALVLGGRCVEGPLLGSAGEVREKLNQRPHLPVFASAPLPPFANVTIAHPSAMVLAQLAEEVDATTTQGPLEPIYLRPPYVTLPNE